MKRPLKILIGLIAAVAIVWLLFTIVFPWVDRTLITDPTLESAPASTSALAAT